MDFETAVQSKSLEDLLYRTVQELYETRGRCVQPCYPWILVRVLPKEEKTTSGIVLPDKQSKVLYEGMVLVTYKAFWRVTTEYGVEIMVPQVGRGDHVLFPHYEGLPDKELDEKKYRLIKEEVICARLDYERPVLREQVVEALLGDEGWDGGVAEELADRILAKFDLVSKQVEAKTLSGA